MIRAILLVGLFLGSICVGRHLRETEQKATQEAQVKILADCLLATPAEKFLLQRAISSAPFTAATIDSLEKSMGLKP